ncbi:hypothetical protein [Candidatus Methanoperedens nitratireducens]|uniref:Uncharacterized protein n=1 Tax=Candidatus Methanoperedens nitratireducens TaxID=1392998 RepID=A0A284VQE3_9EURY|nr:hypothetical protein [Candidatus Methanoperedens nitroreducens]SNQ61423.1 hypothetical protein MNV_340013 [Candidatus Methanoperedens nitroreducens]
MSSYNKEEKLDKSSIDMGLPITIIIFIITLFVNKLFYAVAAAGVLYVGVHAVHYFKNRLEYSKETLAEISRQNELLLEIIRMERNKNDRHE